MSVIPKYYNINVPVNSGRKDGLKHILEILQRIHRFEYEWSDDEQTVIIR